MWGNKTMLSLLATSGFIISVLSILISIIVTWIEKRKGFSPKLNKWIFISLFFALGSTLINEYANNKISESNDNKIDSLKTNLITLTDSVKNVNNKYEDAIFLLDSSKHELENLKHLAPSAYKDIDNKALYQDNKFVGVFNKYILNDQSSIVIFDEIKNADNLIISKPFSFDKYILKIKHVEIMSLVTPSRIQDGKILENVSCIILKRY